MLDRMIGSMSTEDKIELLEMVLRSLSPCQAEFISPAWHGHILAERQRRLESGESIISDWNDAKERLLRMGQ